MESPVTHSAIAFIRRANGALDNWWNEHDELHRAFAQGFVDHLVLKGLAGKTMDQESLLRKLLAGELHYAKLWLICLALRGVSWDKMNFEQRELAFQAKDAASNCLAIFLGSSEYRLVTLPWRTGR